MSRKTILFVTEYAGAIHDGLATAVCQELGRRFPGAPVTIVAGCLKKYTYGGLRPSRLFNYVVVYWKSLTALVRHRPASVLVDTTPPLIHWWMVWLAPLLGAKVIVWINDYHPELEARWFERRWGMGWIACLLRKLDRVLLKRASVLVALDQAMAEEVGKSCPTVPMLVHPTWSEQGVGIYEPSSVNVEASELRLAYIGNLGVSHGLDDLDRLVAHAQERRAVRFLAIGGNRAGRDALQKLARRRGVVCECEGRLPWNQLRGRVNSFRPDYAVVLMDQGKRGLLSPSKYSSYLQLGLPILYLGPRGTNADRVCREQGAGVALTHAELTSAPAAVAASLLDIREQQQRRMATHRAFLELQRFNAASFVELLAPWISKALAT